MIEKVLWMGVTLLLLAFLSIGTVLADQRDQKAVMTFSQPMEIPGHVLPAGIYTFKLADSKNDRHFVHVFNADGSRLVATVMTIPNQRLTVSGQTVIRFRDVPAGSLGALRAWFIPGHAIGHEFVYPKPRATQLAKAANAIVPAMAVDVADLNALKTAPIIAITPEEMEIPVTPIQTASVQRVANVGLRAAQKARPALPQTASAMPLILFLGLGSIGAACGLMIYGRLIATQSSRP